LRISPPIAFLAAVCVIIGSSSAGELETESKPYGSVANARAFAVNSAGTCEPIVQNEWCGQLPAFTPLTFGPPCSSRMEGVSIR
jgi:hypothetical protein